MRLEYHIAKKDFFAARRYARMYSPSVWRRLWYAGPITTVVLFSILFEILPPAFARPWLHHHWALAGGALFAVFLIHTLFRTQLANRAYDQASELKGPLWIETSEDGIAIPSGTYPWAGIRRSVDMKTMFLLFPANRISQPVMVPKRNLPPEQIARFSALLIAEGARNYFPVVGAGWLA